MRSHMTHENEKPDGISAPVAEPQERENILLNWILMIVGFGAIALVAIYLPALL